MSGTSGALLKSHLWPQCMFHSGGPVRMPVLPHWLPAAWAVGQGLPIVTFAFQWQNGQAEWEMKGEITTQIQHSLHLPEVFLTQGHILSLIEMWKPNTLLQAVGVLSVEGTSSEAAICQESNGPPLRSGKEDAGRRRTQKEKERFLIGDWYSVGLSREQGCCGSDC